MKLSALFPARLTRLPPTLVQNRDGVAAIEFAYIAPVLALMLLGTVEIGRAFDMNRHYNLVTSTVADLVAREQSVTQADLDGIMQAVQLIMQPYPISDANNNPLLALNVLQVTADPSNVSNTKVSWGYAYPAGGSVPATCSSYSLQSGLVSAGGSIIVVNASYRYSPLLTGAVGNPMSNQTWTDQATNSPRNSCVQYGSNTCLFSC
jgi:hypothetical protein